VQRKNDAPTTTLTTGGVAPSVWRNAAKKNLLRRNLIFWEIAETIISLNIGGEEKAGGDGDAETVKARVEELYGMKNFEDLRKGIGEGKFKDIFVEEGL